MCHRCSPQWFVSREGIEVGYSQRLATILREMKLGRTANKDEGLNAPNKFAVAAYSLCIVQLNNCGKIVSLACHPLFLA